MTEIAEMPVMSFKTTKRETPRPQIEFELDDRMVTATAPKAAWWTRLWLAQTSNNAVELYAEFRAFLTISLGPGVAGWLRVRENDVNDSYDLPDMMRLVEYLADQFGPLMKDEFEAAGMTWQRISAGTPAEEQPEGAAKAGATAAKPRKAAKKPAARRG